MSDSKDIKAPKIRNENGAIHPINYTKSYGSPSFKRHGINAKTSSIRTRS